MLLTATVITDASWCPQSGAAGWAAWIRVDRAPAPIKHSGSLKRPADNATVAEMMAALNGVHIAAGRGAEVILLQSDCMGVIDAINEPFRKNWITLKWKALLVESGLDRVTLRAKHVKGHTKVQDARSYVNRWCDSEAGKHMRRMRKTVSGELDAV